MCLERLRQPKNYIIQPETAVGTANVRLNCSSGVQQLWTLFKQVQTPCDQVHDGSEAQSASYGGPHVQGKEAAA